MEKRIRTLILLFGLFISTTGYSHPPFSEAFTKGIQGLFITVSGHVVDTKGNPIADVEVILNANLIEYPRSRKTNENGFYSFSMIPTGHDYEISAYKDKDDKLGVSSLDYVMIIRHMLGIQELDSPYKIIAADINADNKVTGIDLLPLRRIILGVISKFPRNTSYRVLDANYEFPDPKNPWPDENNYPYLIPFTPDQDVTFNFIGIKIGNIN